MAEESDDQPSSPMRAVAGLLLLVGLIVGVLFIMRQLQHAATIQDCVASGRTNCAPIETPSR
jgi:hypothetical protein